MKTVKINELFGYWPAQAFADNLRNKAGQGDGGIHRGPDGWAGLAPGLFAILEARTVTDWLAFMSRLKPRSTKPNRRGFVAGE